MSMPYERIAKGMGMTAAAFLISATAYGLAMGAFGIPRESDRAIEFACDEPLIGPLNRAFIETSEFGRVVGYKLSPFKE